MACISKNYNFSIENIQNAHILCDGFLKFLNCILNHLTQLLQNFSICYLQYEAVAFCIISNGFVNAIPKSEGEMGKTKDVDTGENCGMGNTDGGDGASATDVSNQMDNMGQVEGLKVNFNFV